MRRLLKKYYSISNRDSLELFLYENDFQDLENYPFVAKKKQLNQMTSGSFRGKY